MGKVRKDEEGDGAPPLTRIDLAKGTAHVVLPGETRPSDPRRPAIDSPSSPSSPSETEDKEGGHSG